MKKLFTVFLVSVSPFLFAQAPPDVNAGPDTTVCGGGSVTLTAVATGGVPPYTYLWSPGGGSSATHVVSPVTTTNYTVTVFDSNGKKGTDMVTVFTNLKLTFKTTDALCFGDKNGTATVTASGGLEPYTYLWMPDSQTTAAISGVSAGTYTVTVSDAGICTQTATVTVKEPPDIIIALSKTEPGCAGNNGSVCATVSGGKPGYTYLWSNGIAASCINNLSPGTYTLTVTDQSGCEKKAKATLQASQEVQITLSSADAKCYGEASGTITSTVSGIPPYTYVWSNGSASANITGLKAGTYTVTVTDKSGCQATKSATIGDPAPMNITTSSTSANCGASDGSVSVNITGGGQPFNYLWSPGGATTSSVNNLAAGSYTVTVTNKNGCTQTAVAAVSNKNAATVTVSQKDVLCAGQKNGSATAIASGGTGPYSYSWNTSPVQTSAVATGLGAGTWVVTVTGNNGCKTVMSVVISEPAPLNVSLAVKNTTCTGCCNGSATATGSGGVPAYTYSWNTSPAQTGAISTGLCTGIYSVTITDARGSSAVSQVIILNTPTGVDERASSSGEISVFPNPFTDEISVAFGRNAGPVEIKVFNLMGQIVFAEPGALPLNETFTLRLGEAPPGIYFLRITESSGNVRQAVILRSEK